MVQRSTGKKKKGNISSTWIVFLPVLSDTLISVCVSAPGQLIHLVFCPMIVRLRKWSFHGEGRKCVCQWLITVLAQQLWGGVDLDVMSVLLWRQGAGVGLKMRKRRGAGDWESVVNKAERAKILDLCLYDSMRSLCVRICVRLSSRANNLVWCSVREGLRKRSVLKV